MAANERLMPKLQSYFDAAWELDGTLTSAVSFLWVKVGILNNAGLKGAIIKLRRYR